MHTHDPLMDLLGAGDSNGAELARRLGISRQAVHKRLRNLVLAGAVARRGATRGAVYALAGKQSRSPEAQRTLSRRLPLAGLDEGRVFEEIDRALQLTRSLPENVAAIFRYAFTEMLNNAIDHSGSAFCRVTISQNPYDCAFTVRDYGVGVFHSIALRFGFDDESRAVEEVMKGKTTTMAERHSGEGIFFTTKVGDVVAFRSHAFELVCDNTREDVILRNCRSSRGTEVTFRLARHSRRVLQDVFREYAPAEADYRFEKTRIDVRLYQHDYVSRSEARRVATGLDKFTEVILDFTAVKGIGQGFADELFRVFSADHPAIRFEVVNAAEAVKTMIRHAVDKIRIAEVDNRLTIAPWTAEVRRN